MDVDSFLRMQSYSTVLRYCCYRMVVSGPSPMRICLSLFASLIRKLHAALTSYEAASPDYPTVGAAPTGTMAAWGKQSPDSMACAFGRGLTASALSAQRLREGGVIRTRTDR